MLDIIYLKQQIFTQTILQMDKAMFHGFKIIKIFLYVLEKYCYVLDNMEPRSKLYKKRKLCTLCMRLEISNE